MSVKYPVCFGLVFILMILPATAFAFADYYSWGIGVGQASADLNEANIVANYPQLTGNSTFTDSATSFLLSGSARLDPLLSLDMEVLLLGNIKATESGVEKKLFDISIFSLAAAFNHDFSDNISGYARLGVHLWDSSVGADSSDSVDNSIDMTYGLGLDINLYGGRDRMMRVQWDHYNFDGLFINSTDVISISIRFMFGL